MKIARSLKATLAASVCLLPLQAYAQSDTGNKPAATPAANPIDNWKIAPGDNWVEIGGEYQNNRGYYLDRYRGRPDPGFTGNLDLRIRGRDPWDSGGTRFWDIEGKDLGYQDRSFSAKFGQQGTWELHFSYDGIPYFGAEDFRSIWTKSGALVPGVAPASIGLPTVAGASGVAFKSIAPAVPSLGFPYVGKVAGPPIWQPVFSKSISGTLYNYTIGTQRDVFTGGGKYQWNDWTITASMRHEHKSGYQANSLNISGTPSPTSSSATAPTALTSALGYFAMPIDYDTDRYDITAAYGNQKVQAEIGYTFSNFTDNLQAFNASNPYGFTGAAFGTTANQAGMFAPYVLPPSNSAHQIKMMFGYNITPTMRVNANFAYGLQMQNASYDLASGSPGATQAGAPASMLTEPRGSLNGLVRTLFGNVAFTARPLAKMDVRVSYTIDDRDNQTTRNLYAEDHNTLVAVPSPNVYSNLPFSFDHQTLTGEIGYRILPQTKVTLNDTFETTFRTYANASFVTSNTITAKVRSQIFESLFGALSYSHQDRNANNYNNNLTWAALGDTARDPSGFLMYFETSRVHDDVKGTLDYSPIHDMTASLMIKYARDTYPDGSTGLRNNHNLTIGPDLNWQVSPTLTAHAFYTYQQIYYEQSTLYESSTTAPPTAAQFVVPWSTKTTDSVHTAGVTVEWKPLPDLKVSFDYNFAYGDTAYALGDSVSIFGASVAGSQLTQQTINLQPLPDVTSMLNMVQIRGEYTFRPNMTLIFGYAFERFTYKDFMNGTSPTQYANLLLPGTLNPNESIHMVGAGMRIRF